MNPVLLGMIPGLVDSALKIWAKVRELKEKRDSGQPITPADIDALFAAYEHKTYDDYIEDARARARE